MKKEFEKRLAGSADMPTPKNFTRLLNANTYVTDITNGVPLIVKEPRPNTLPSIVKKSQDFTTYSQIWFTFVNPNGKSAQSF